MKEGQPVETRLEDYEAPAFTTTDVALEFDIHPGATTVRSTLQVERLTETGDDLYLDGIELELLSISLDGEPLGSNQYSLSDEGLTLHGLKHRHTVEIETRIEPEANTALEGLYRSSAMYCTQCEAQGFRKITYYQDRPDVQARFTTTVVADGDAYPDLLSNGNKVAETTNPDGRKAVTWNDPFPKPSYLFALVAGKLASIEDTFTTRSGREVKLIIYSEPHNIGQCDYSMDVLKRSMRWDEERFGREYDLDIFMIVAVEDFNMGAMENKGLNIFNTSCVLASPDTATDAAYLRVEAVVAHEYFHNWSGNRVTCRDWFQLSLKEGFTVYRDAEFSSDENSRSVKRIEDVSFLRAVQFAEDAGPLAHPVRPRSYLEISNFYTTTIYEKGAEVVRMYETLIGREAFRRGSDLYFERHDGSAATTDDFLRVMAEAGERDLAQFQRWYEQAGTPRLKATQTFADDCLILQLEQSCRPTPGQETKLPFLMPLAMGLVDREGDVIDLNNLKIDSACAFSVRDGGTTLLLELTEANSSISFTGLSVEPVISLLRGFSAPVNVSFARDNSSLAHLVTHDIDGFVRWDSLQTLWLGWFAPEPTATLADDLVPVMGSLLDQAIERAGGAPGGDLIEQQLLLAHMLSIPDANYLFEQLPTFTVERVLDGHDQAQAELGSMLQGKWRSLYELTRAREPYSPAPRQMAQRALNHVALGYLAAGLDAEGVGELLEAHYFAAYNLTARRAALALACQLPEAPPATRGKILADLRDRWSSEALVMDLWFNLQAQSPHSSVDDLIELEADDLFDLKNPNRVRSLYAAFGMYNHRRFHDLDGSGYDFLARVLKRLDKSNPQIASRLATPLTRWQRYDTKRGAMMRARLEELMQQDLSKDLYEIVSKSLA
ncbi:MAG: aminopeptidase N [Pseudomonadota bacterium]